MKMAFGLKVFLLGLFGLASQDAHAQSASENGAANLTRTAPLSDLPIYMEMLKDPALSFDTLIVTLAGGTEFFQFASDSGVVTLDFPLITDRQKDAANSAEILLSRLGQNPYYIEGGGHRFLNSDLSGSLEEISEVSVLFGTEVLGVSRTADMEYLLMDAR